jgi:acyl-coenzyme A thioesterase PaaI-like protein
MGKRQIRKEKRRKAFLDMIGKDPFQTDEEIADALNVSVPTVRLDRAELSIPELRERIRRLAGKARGKVRALDSGEIIGQIVELELNNAGVSVLETDGGMGFEKTGIVRGHFIYALAETLAIAVINEDSALVGVANVKYSVPVAAGSRLIARCELRDVKDIGKKRYFGWVKIYVKKTEVF